MTNDTTVRRSRREPRWHAVLAVAAALALYITLPPKVTIGPVWIAPLLVPRRVGTAVLFGAKEARSRQPPDARS